MILKIKASNRNLCIVCSVTTPKQRPAVDKVKLAQAIGKAIDEYKFKYSCVNNEMIRASLNLVLNVFPENISENVENIDKL